MKAVILAGGIGTRLWPFTAIINKHLVMIYDRPQILWLYEQLKDFEIGIVIGNKGNQIKEFFKNIGEDKNITWIDQGKSIEKNTIGLAYAISKAEEFAKTEPLLVVLGDQFAPDIDLKRYFQDFVKSKDLVRILLRWNNDAGKHTIIKIINDKIDEITEKPKHIVGPGYTMTGFYCIKPEVFNYLDQVKRNENSGQLEFSDAVKLVLKDVGKVSYEIFNEPWFDCGTPMNVLEASNYAVIAASKIGGDDRRFYV